MSPYRALGSRPEAPPPPRGLVRANGSACTCRPPGMLWRWWFDVGIGDSWFCTHGGRWIYSNSPGGYFQLWKAAEHKSEVDR